MTQCDGATSGINIVNPEAEDLGVGFNYGGEGFVELPDGNVGLGKA